MKADIFIPTTGNVKALNLCLKSLERQPNKYFKIILVANKKMAEIEKLISNFRTLRINYLIQRELELVGAANAALKNSTNSIFIRIDDDVVVTRYWLANIIKTFNSDQKIGAVTGPTLMTEKGMSSRDSIMILEELRRSKNFIFKILFILYKNYIYEGKLYAVSAFAKSGAFSLGSNFRKYIPKISQEVENLEACNFAVKKSLLKKIGGFDKTFERGLGEYHEADVAFKIRNLGYKIIFDPKVKVQHKVELSRKKIRPDAWRRISNFIVFYRRHIGIKNLDYFCRFLTNVLFQNSYHLYKFLKK